MLRTLVADADVVVSNFRSGVMERMGFGYEDAQGGQPAASSGPPAPASATTGPYAHKGGQDVDRPGLLRGDVAARVRRQIPLSVYPTTLCDYTTGMHLMQGILLALLRPEPHRRGAEGRR